jgi:hypothetical protein
VPVLAALVVAGALAGCGDGQPGAAAVVGDRVVRTADLETAIRELGSVYGTDAVSSTGVLMSLVQAPVVLEQAAAVGVTTTEDQAREALAADAAAAGADVSTGGFSPATLELIRMSLAVERVDGGPDVQRVSAAISEELAAHPPRLNPRYGVVTDGGLGVTTYPWLAAGPAAPVP